MLAMGAYAPQQEPENQNKRGAKAFVEKYEKRGWSIFKASAVIIFVRTATLTHTCTHTIWRSLLFKVVRIMCSGSGDTNPGSACALFSLLSCTAPHGAHR